MAIPSYMLNSINTMSDEMSESVRSAIALRDTHQLRLLLHDERVDMNDRLSGGGDYDGYTPLQFAVAMESVRCVKVLLSYEQIKILPLLPNGGTLGSVFRRPLTKNGKKILAMLEDFFDNLRIPTPTL